jgi:hypothetical protein
VNGATTAIVVIGGIAVLGLVVYLATRPVTGVGEAQTVVQQAADNTESIAIAGIEQAGSLIGLALAGGGGSGSGSNAETTPGYYVGGRRV